MHDNIYTPYQHLFRVTHVQKPKEHLKQQHQRKSSVSMLLGGRRSSIFSSSTRTSNCGISGIMPRISLAAPPTSNRMSKRGTSVRFSTIQQQLQRPSVYSRHSSTGSKASNNEEANDDEGTQPTIALTRSQIRSVQRLSTYRTSLYIETQKELQQVGMSLEEIEDAGFGYNPIIADNEGDVNVAALGGSRRDSRLASSSLSRLSMAPGILQELEELTNLQEDEDDVEDDDGDENENEDKVEKHLEREVFHDEKKEEDGETKKDQ